MKPVLATCFILLQACLLSAQIEFAPVGAFWNYGTSAHSGAGYGNMTIKVIKDTVVNGKVKKKLEFTHVFNGSSIPGGCASHAEKGDFGYLFSRNDSVFFNDLSNPSSDQFQYHFHYNEGDTFTTTLMGFDGYFNTVKDTSTIVLGIDTLKQFDIELVCPYDTSQRQTYTLIEGIGPVTMPLILSTWVADCFLLAGCAEHVYFSCYRNGGWLYPVEAGVCSPIIYTSIDKEPSAAQLKIGYDRNSSMLWLSSASFKGGKLELADLTGRIVVSHQLTAFSGEQRLPAVLTPGVYIVVVRTEEGEVETQKVRVE